jgi:chromosome partitioning protein
VKVLVVANSAGGVGKSTSVHCIAVAASEYGKKVLVIDADPSAGLTFACGIENPRVSTKEFLSGQFSLDASTIKSGERFSIIASSSRYCDTVNRCALTNTTSAISNNKNLHFSAPT